VSLTDDDTIYTATLPAGTMLETKPGAKWLYSDTDGSIDGIRKATLKINSKGKARLVLRTVKLALPNADPIDHFVHSTVSAASFTAEHVRLWQIKGTSLRPEN
jgi:hypothetical protein